MAHRLLRDPDSEGWERADFPIVCETCLGPNPYVRMQRMEFGGECHISGRPYTKFRWRPGNDARYKGTIICQEVAKAKNVCQVCLLDLDYNLPVQVRDHALGVEDEALPESDVGREFALERMANEGELGAAFTGSGGKPNDTILQLQRTNPYYQRNRAPICSFFVKGECKRGAECPYRHEMPTTGELAQQNIKDRYFGVNDPVARKMMNRAHNLPELVPPEDPTITTLYVGGVQPELTEEDISAAFTPYGEISSVRKIETRGCAFVSFVQRPDAEEAASKLQNKLIIKGSRLKLMWGKPQERAEGSRNPNPPPGPAPMPRLAGMPGAMVPPQVQRQMNMAAAQPPSAAPPIYNLPAAVQSTPAAYASMDPQQQGTRAPEEPQKRRSDAEVGPDPKRQAVGQGLPGQFLRPAPGQFAPMGPPGARPPLAMRPMGPPQGFPRGPFPMGPGRPAMQVLSGPPQGWGGPPPGARPPPAGPRPTHAQ